jgi:hypothetical protein
MEEIIETDLILYTWTTDLHMYASLSKDKDILITHVYKYEEDLIKDIQNIKRYVKKLNIGTVALYEIEFKLSKNEFLNGIESRLLNLFNNQKGVACYYNINRQKINKIEVMNVY